MNTNSTRYERYERSSTPVDTATMKRTSHRTAKRQGFKAYARSAWPEVDSTGTEARISAITVVAARSLSRACG